MKRSYVIVVLIAGLCCSILNAQSTLNLSDYVFEVDNLEDAQFVSYTKKALTNSQFVFVGEQHGIKEAGIFTNAIYNLGQPYGYKTLCIETDAVAAQQITNAAKSGFVNKMKPIHESNPFSIPFYENEDDALLFENVTAKGGNIWGIDQTFMTQFRINFEVLIANASNSKFKSKLESLTPLAKKAYKKAVDTKDFSAPFLFSYDENTHNELLGLTNNQEERQVLKQLWKTKEIYTYNDNKEYYLNNYVRSQLMKENFMRYYKQASETNDNPKVIFKLGANHAAKGLTRTNVYDISNMGSELAQSNGLSSLHFIVMGIYGKMAVGNPMSPTPVVPFDNIKQFPKEIQELAQKSTKKYFIMDMAALRPLAYGKTLSEEFKKIIFGYDVLVLVNDAEPLNMF